MKSSWHQEIVPGRGEEGCTLVLNLLLNKKTHVPIILLWQKANEIKNSPSGKKCYLSAMKVIITESAWFTCPWIITQQICPRWHFTFDILHIPEKAFSCFCIFLGKRSCKLLYMLLLVQLHNCHIFWPETLRLSSLPDATDSSISPIGQDSQEEDWGAT